MQREQLISKARSIPCGSRVRIKCCKADASMLLKHDMAGVSWYCFRCGDRDWEPHGMQSLDDLKRRTEEYREQIVSKKSLVLPDDYTQDVPMYAAVWYLSKGISYEMAKDFGIGFSPSLDRVVLPVYEDVWRKDISGTQLVNVQLRTWREGIKPKYITPGAYMFPAAMFWNCTYMEDTVIVTEDILSSIKVGRTADCCSTLGTNLSAARAWKIAQHYGKALVWYDNDAAGISAAKTALNQLELMGVQADKIRTEHDPKWYSREEIETIVKKAKENLNG